MIFGQAANFPSDHEITDACLREITSFPCARPRTMKSKTSSPISEPRLRVGLKDVSREEFAAAVGERQGTKQVTLKLNASVVAFFKARAGKQSYEALINQALHRAMDNECMEDRLRRVVREELASHGQPG